MRTKGIHGLIVATCLGFSGVAHSALVASLTFKDPSGVVSPTESIDIWVTLSLAVDSDPLKVDRDAGYPFGLPTSFIPTHTFTGTPFASYSTVSNFSGRTCNDTFMNSDCSDGSNYRFNYNFGANSFSWAVNDPAGMDPGESRDFLFGTFTPVGAAALGEYTLFNVRYGLFFQGLDAKGNSIDDWTTLASTCESSSSVCAFTRTVVSDVPLPAAALLFASGLGLLGAARRIYRR